MKRTVFFLLLMFVCLAASDTAFGQSEAKDDKKVCPFSIVGTWKMEGVATQDPTLFRFASDGTVTMMGSATNIKDTDFEVKGAMKYRLLDKPAAPKQIEFIAVRGNEVFGKGTTSLEITEFNDDSFTTVNPASGLTRWVRAQTKRYFLTFAARSIIAPNNDSGPSFAMWTTLDGHKTEVEALGLHYAASKSAPTFGPIPAALYKDFTKESDSKSDVMVRFELTEAEYERSHKVFNTWDKRARTRALLYDNPHLNGMEFLKRTAESLNQCGAKVKLSKMDWHQNDEIVSKFDIPQHPLEYIKLMRKRNETLHVTDAMFPKDWHQPRQLSGQ